jgi:hypothetical protein
VDKVSDTPMMDVVLKNLQYFDENTQTQLQSLYAQGCSLERKLAALKEQYRVLEDELLVLGDERNAAVSELEIYRQREADIFKSLTAVIT